MHSPGNNMEIVSPNEGYVEAMTALSDTVPLNEFGMPAHIYRADLVPHNYTRLSPQDQEGVKSRAKLPLFYSDGFPTTRNGSLFWDRMDHEGGADFTLFRQYLEMIQHHGYRSIQVLARAIISQRSSTKREIEARKASIPEGIFLDVETQSNPHVKVPPPPPGTGTYGTRVKPNGDGSNIAGDYTHTHTHTHTHDQTPSPSAGPQALSAAAQTIVEEDEELVASTLSHLRELYVLYFWRYRAEAFDIVGQAAVRKVRESRAILLEDHHFTQLSGMVAKTMARFNAFTDEDMKRLDPVETVKVMKELIHMQRVATGLPAQGPADAHLPGNAEGNAATSVEDHLRHIQKQKGKNKQSGFGDLLNDESTAELAQELAMRMILQGRN